jgi:hypothetical protein
MGTSVSDAANTTTPRTFFLYQNYPNPFNPQTSIRYEIIKPDQVSLVIFDILGRAVRTLVNERKQAGSYEIQWNGRSDDGHLLPSGVYLMQLRAKDAQISRRMLLLK